MSIKNSLQALTLGATVALAGCGGGAAEKAAAIEHEGNMRKVVQSDAEILRLRASINLYLGKKCKDAPLVTESKAEVDVLETSRQQCIRAAITNAERDKTQEDYVTQCEPVDQKHRVNTTCIANNFSENPKIITAIVRCNETLVSALNTTDRTLQSCGGTTRW